MTATASRVLLSKGAPILAKYSSSNGGRSVSGGRPYLPSVTDADDAAAAVNVGAVAPPPAGEPPSLELAEPAPVPHTIENPDAFGPLEPVPGPVPSAAITSGPSGRWVALPGLILLSAIGWALSRGRRSRRPKAGRSGA